MDSEDDKACEYVVTETEDLNSLQDLSVPVFTSRTRLSRIIPPSQRKRIKDLAKESMEGSSQPVLAICKNRSRTAVAPLERLKILLQVQNPHDVKYNGTIQGIKYMWRTEGIRGLFKGNGTHCARIVPNSVVKFFSYEEAYKRLLSMYRRQTGNACAGIIATSVTYPMDMIRSRITLQTEKSPCQYRGMCHGISTVLEEEGARALYKGWLPSMLGVVPYVALNFAVYESLSDWLIKSNPFGLANDSDLSVMTQLACGVVSGTVGQTVAYPLDVIRRRMQVVGWHNAPSFVTGDGRGKAPLEYNGMIDAFRRTVRHEGFGALYKGLVPNSLKIVEQFVEDFDSLAHPVELLDVEVFNCETDD